MTPSLSTGYIACVHRTPAEKAALAEFGRRVATLRSRCGQSQERLAEGSGLHRTYISMIEHGHPNLALSNVLQLARALEVDPSELVRGLRL